MIFKKVPNYQLELYKKSSDKWQRCKDPKLESVVSSLFDYVTSHNKENVAILNLPSDGTNSMVRARVILDKPYGPYRLKEFLMTERGTLLSFSESLLSCYPDLVPGKVIPALELIASKAHFSSQEFETSYCFGFAGEHSDMPGFILKGCDSDDVYSGTPFYPFDDIEFIGYLAIEMLVYLLSSNCGAIIEVKEEPGETDEDDYESD